MAKMYVVVREDLGENVWSEEDGSPTVFKTRKEAFDAVREHVADTKAAVKSGDLLEADSMSDYEVVEVSSVWERWHDLSPKVRREDIKPVVDSVVSELLKIGSALCPSEQETILEEIKSELARRCNTRG